MSEENKLSSHWLPLPLTVDQKAEMAEKMSELRIQAEKLEEQKKASSKAYNNQIESVQDELLEISKTIETGYKETEVDCECRWNFPKDGVVSYYNEYGEEVFSREMTESEIEIQSQPDMFDGKQQLEPEEEKEEVEN
jgi:hypothetical protein